MNNFRNALFGIDLQNDFCKPDGALFVQGAVEDTERTVKMIEDNIDSIDYISLTQDSHQALHIAHPAWFKDKDGNYPPPFTIITSQDIIDGKWTPQLFPKQTLDYLKDLETNGEYPHCIWFEHCIIGTEGAAITNEVMNAVLNWQRKTMKLYQIFQKGQFPLAEHFGAFRANVQHNSEPSTQFNTALYNKLNKYQRVFFFGQAKSHCVGNTLKQMLQYCPDLLPKLHIVTDCMSDVTGFDDIANGIFAEAEQKGAKLVTAATAEFIK